MKLASRFKRHNEDLSNDTTDIPSFTNQDQQLPLMQSYDRVHLFASNFKVHIIGHSCGITDRALLKEIFEHPNCKDNRVFFYRRPDGSNSFEETTLQILRHFSNKQTMRRKVVSKDQLDVIPQFKF